MKTLMLQVLNTNQGKNVHPGTAKNIMINSQLVAMDIEAVLPE